MFFKVGVVQRNCFVGSPRASAVDLPGSGFRVRFFENLALFFCYVSIPLKSGVWSSPLPWSRCPLPLVLLFVVSALPPPMQPQLLYFSTLLQLRLVSFIVYRLSLIVSHPFDCCCLFGIFSFFRWGPRGGFPCFFPLRLQRCRIVKICRSRKMLRN